MTSLSAEENFHQALYEAGKEATDLVLPGSTWVHRRVESIRYLELDLLEVRLSIDFTIPDGCEAEYVPLTILPKWPPVFRLDYRDDSGRPLPLLTSAENGAADYGLMEELSKRLDPSLMQDDRYQKALMALARGPETHLRSQFATLREIVALSDGADALAARLVDFAAALTDSTLLWMPVDRIEPGHRTIVKLSYVIPSSNTDHLLLKALRSLAWYQPNEIVPLRHVGADANYHVEFEAPSVLTVRDAVPKYLWLKNPPERYESDGATQAAEEVGLRPQQHVACEGRFAHIYVSGRRPMGVDLYYRLAPMRNGFVTAAFVASLLIALLVTAFYAERGAMSNGDVLGGAVTLLAVVPALIGYLVTQSSSEPLVRRYLLGVQALVVAAAIVPAAMGVALLEYAGRPHCLTTAWLVSMVVAWAITGCLLVSTLRSGSRSSG